MTKVKLRINSNNVKLMVGIAGILMFVAGLFDLFFCLVNFVYAFANDDSIYSIVVNFLYAPLLLGGGAIAIVLYLFSKKLDLKKRKILSWILFAIVVIMVLVFLVTSFISLISALFASGFDSYYLSIPEDIREDISWELFNTLAIISFLIISLLTLITCAFCFGVAVLQLLMTLKAKPSDLPKYQEFIDENEHK